MLHVEKLYQEGLNTGSKGGNGTTVVLGEILPGGPTPARMPEIRVRFGVTDVKRI